MPLSAVEKGHCARGVFERVYLAGRAGADGDEGVGLGGEDLVGEEAGGGVGHVGLGSPTVFRLRWRACGTRGPTGCSTTSITPEAGSPSGGRVA